MSGAGSAGIGVLGMVQREMVAQGLSEAEAAERIWVVDVVGLLTDDRTDLSPDSGGSPSRRTGWRGGDCRGRHSSPTSCTTWTSGS